MPELRHYRYFVEVARQGTFTAAAEALHMTQSALSEQILQLERECQCQLFHRSRPGTRLTPAGEYLLPQAEALLLKAAEVKAGLASFRQGYRDRIRIGSLLGPLQSWLPAALAQFTQIEPQVQIQVDHTRGVEEILALVRNHHLDVGIVTMAHSRPARPRDEELVETLLMEEDLVVLAPAEHPLCQLASASHDDLREVPLVTFPSGYTLRGIIDQWYRRAGIGPVVAAETGSMEVMLRLVSGGVGVALVARSLSWLGLGAGLRAVDMGPDPPRRIVVAVHRRADPRAEVLTTLVNLMVVHAQDAGRLATISSVTGVTPELSQEV
jgi:DNA-binding transcriptional LysR family regulator